MYLFTNILIKKKMQDNFSNVRLKTKNQHYMDFGSQLKSNWMC